MGTRGDLDVGVVKAAPAAPVGRLFGLKGKPLSFTGGNDRWEVKVALPGELTAEELMSQIDNSLTAKDKWSKQDSKSSCNALLHKWRFTDGQGRNWTGISSVTRAPGKKEELIVTMKIERNAAGPRAAMNKLNRK